VCLLDPSDARSAEVCERLVADLQKQNTEVFIDDREERPGIKFKDADLLGLPVRVNIGKRGLEAGELEVILRKTKEIKKLAPDAAAKVVVEWLGSL
jgi:prolyl-tRNA synthetase